MSNAGRMGKSKEKGTLVPEPVIGSDSTGSASSTTMKSLELVEWRDANFTVDDTGSPEDYLVATVGWTQKEGRWLKITSEVTPDGERAITRVPPENVVKRTRLFLSTSSFLPEATDSITLTSQNAGGTDHGLDCC